MWSTPAQGTLKRVMEREGVRVAEVEPVQPLGDDDRVAAVGGEVHVVRVVDRDRRARPARARVDRRQAVAGVVGDVERLQIPRRHHVLWQRADGEVLDDPVGVRVDHVDGVALAVRDVDERLRGSRRAGQHVRAVVGVDVALRRRRLCRARRRAWGPSRSGRARSVRPPCRSRRVRPRAGSGSPSATAARSERGDDSDPAFTMRPVRGSTATILAVALPSVAPRPPTT